MKQFITNFRNKLFIAVVAVVPPANPNTNTGAGDLGVNLTIQSVFAIITGLVCWFTRFALIAMVAAVIVYGIQFMMSQGNPESYKKARASLTWGVVGIAVILGTYTIIATVANAVGANYTLIVPLNCSTY